MSVTLDFGEYLPDLPPHRNSGATEAKNVLPFGNSYKQFNSLAVFSGALTARCQGVAYGRDYDGTTYTFAGDASKLYELSAATWGDVSKAGGYTCGNDEMWEFTIWANQMLAANFGDPIQEYTMGTSALFANLSADADAPQARHISVIRDFVVVGNTYDVVDGNRPNRIRWCAIGDPTDWTVSATTQADYQDLQGPYGQVQKIIGGEFGVVFQEKAITRMSYVGSPQIFQFDVIEEGKGTPAPQSVIKIGRNIYYLGDDGFYVFNGSDSISISNNKISKTFYADIDQNYMYRVSVAVDPINQIIFWAYPGTSNTNGTPNKIIAYNYGVDSAKKWSYAEITTELIATVALNTGYTLDSLVAVSTNIDTLEFSLDSRVWTSNSILLSAFNTSHQYCTFTGSALDAVIETGEHQLIQGRRSRVNKIRPIVEVGNTITTQTGERSNLANSVSWSAATSLDANGDADVRSNSFYHRFRVNITGGFTHAQGVELKEIYTGGTR